MAVDWTALEPFITSAFETHGRVERADVVDLAYDASADDDVIDTLDAIGSRVFNTPDDVKAFLVGQNLVNG